MLEQANADVLILLDCCAAAASSTAEVGSGVTELVAACGFETTAPGAGEHSFTRSLIDELKGWSPGPPLSIVRLHCEVLSRIKYWKPRYGRTADHREHRKAPVYIALANQGKPRSIELTPFARRNITSPEQPFATCQSSLSPSSEEDTEMAGYLNSVSPNSSHSSLGNPEKRVALKCPRVLISVALEEDQYLKCNAWIDWLKSVPAIAKSAHIEGIYESDSTLLLLTLPIETWDLLPKDLAVKFISFVKSRNMSKCSSFRAANVNSSSTVLEEPNWAPKRPGNEDLILMNLGKSDLYSQQPPETIEIFKDNARNYPTSNETLYDGTGLTAGSNWMVPEDFTLSPAPAGPQHAIPQYQPIAYNAYGTGLAQGTNQRRTTSASPTRRPPETKPKTTKRQKRRFNDQEKDEIAWKRNHKTVCRPCRKAKRKVRAPFRDKRQV